MILAVLKLMWVYRRFVGSVLGVVALYALYGLWHAHVFTLGEVKERAIWVAKWAARDEAEKAAVTAELERQRKQREADAAHNAEISRAYYAQLLAIANTRDELARSVREYQARLAAASGALPQAGGQPGAATTAEVPSSPGSFDALLADYDTACRADTAQLAALEAEVGKYLEAQ